MSTSSPNSYALGSPATRIVSPQDAKNNPRPRKFAPLDPARKGEQHNAQTLKGIIFDVDGTLCLPQNYMFREMRQALGIPKSIDILEHIRSLSSKPDEQNGTSHATEPPPKKDQDTPPLEIGGSHTATSPDSLPSSPQSRAVAKIRAIERNAMVGQVPQPGLQELMSYLSQRGIPKGLCTRNFPAPVDFLLKNHLKGHKFDPIITRETEGVQPKPNPEGLWKIAQAWGLDKDIDKEMEAQKKITPSELDPVGLVRTTLGAGLIMVGDSIDDMAAGHRAGAATVLLVNDDNRDLAKHEYTDMAIDKLDDLVAILDKGFIGRS